MCSQLGSCTMARIGLPLNAESHMSCALQRLPTTDAKPTFSAVTTRESVAGRSLPTRCDEADAELRGVGFTFFDHVGGDRNVAQCCFLRRATRWQPNFRRASCHLARGGRAKQKSEGLQNAKRISFSAMGPCCCRILVLHVLWPDSSPCLLARSL